jgi:hypothetical protein
MKLDHDIVLVAIIAAIPATISAAAALIAAVKIHQIEKGVNGLQEKLVSTTRSEAFAAGIKHEREK